MARGGSLKAAPGRADGRPAGAEAWRVQKPTNCPRPLCARDGGTRGRTAAGTGAQLARQSTVRPRRAMRGPRAASRRALFAIGLLGRSRAAWR
jgi:hypothetical protein